MGSTSSCFKDQHINQNEFQIPVIVKQKLIQHHPTKQNYLIEPLFYLGEKSESLEELEAMLQQSYANHSFIQTGTFHSNSNLKGSQKDKQPISLALLPNQLESQQKQRINNKDNQNQNLYQHQGPQDNYQQNKNEVKLNTQSQKRKSFSRSLSIDKLFKLTIILSNNNVDVRKINLKIRKIQIKLLLHQIDRDQLLFVISLNIWWKSNLIIVFEFRLQQFKQFQNQINCKSILKNKQTIKNQKQLQYKRGQSLKQKPNFVEVNDDQSQKTNKSQKKNVKFDPKIFRQKNSHFFQ